MSEAKIKAIAPWFGGKRTLAPEIVAELGPHSAYWEPFCGGLSVLLAKPESSHETVNDLHGDLINLARCIADDAKGPELHDKLQRILTVEDLLRDYDAKVRHDEYDGDEPDVERATAFFVSSWMGRNGYCGLKKSERGRTVAVRWTPNGGHGGQRFASAVDSVIPWHQRMRRALILRRCAFGLLEKIDDDRKVAIYVDSPYIVKSDHYLHDAHIRPKSVGDDEWASALSWAKGWPELPAAEVAWHYCLATRNHRFTKSRIVVSYYDHPILDALYPGWTVRRFDVAKNTGHTQHRGKAGKRATEVLLINGPSLVEKPAPVVAGLF